MKINLSSAGGTSLSYLRQCWLLFIIATGSFLLIFCTEVMTLLWVQFNSKFASMRYLLVSVTVKPKCTLSAATTLKNVDVDAV